MAARAALTAGTRGSGGVIPERRDDPVRPGGGRTECQAVLHAPPPQGAGNRPHNRSLRHPPAGGSLDIEQCRLRRYPRSPLVFLVLTARSRLWNQRRRRQRLGVMKAESSLLAIEFGVARQLVAVEADADARPLWNAQAAIQVSNRPAAFDDVVG